MGGVTASCGAAPGLFRRLDVADLAQELAHLSPSEIHGLILAHVRALIDRQSEAHGYNVGANSGAAAGQTIFHFHLHVIPRYQGDVSDPRGGVRNLIPGAPDPY